VTCCRPDDGRETRTTTAKTSVASWSRAATDAVAHAPEYVDPVPMNIGLIVGVSVAIAVLLAMLAYVVYKCAVAGAQTRGGGARGGKAALGVGGSLLVGQRPAVAALGVERRL